MKDRNMKAKKGVIAILIGTVNSLLGAGGGLLCVPYLRSQGLSQQKAQATSIAVILPLSILSALLYARGSLFEMHAAAVFLLPGIAGAVIGGIFLKKIPAKALKLIFSLFMLYCAVRMFFR